MELMPQEVVAEIGEMLEFGPEAPSKTLQQLLLENPHHAGGLAQLAEAERQAFARVKFAEGIAVSQGSNASRAAA